MNFEARLKEILKQMKPLRFQVKSGHHRVESNRQLENRLKSRLNLAEFSLLSNCSGANRIRSVSLDTGVLSLRICGSLVEHTLFCFPEEVAVEQYKIYSWTPANASESSPALVLCEDWLKTTPTSQGWSFCERSSIVFWFSLLEFPDICGTTPEWTRPCGFKRNSSRCDKVPEMHISVLLSSWEGVFVTLPAISSDTWIV